MHRLRAGNPQSGPIFRNSAKNPLNLNNLIVRVILPALNCCEVCHVTEMDHKPKDGHKYKRDAGLPEWQGWHAARRGLESNLYHLGVPEMVIQRILRHANVSTTATYYIKTAAEDVRFAMAKLESTIPDRPIAENSHPQALSELQDSLGTLNTESQQLTIAVN